jgi:hypothetical protein
MNISANQISDLQVPRMLQVGRAVIRISVQKTVRIGGTSKIELNPTASRTEPIRPGPGVEKSNFTRLNPIQVPPVQYLARSVQNPDLVREIGLLSI